MKEGPIVDQKTLSRCENKLWRRLDNTSLILMWPHSDKKFRSARSSTKNKPREPFYQHTVTAEQLMPQDKTLFNVLKPILRSLGTITSREGRVDGSKDCILLRGASGRSQIVQLVRIAVEGFIGGRRRRRRRC